MSTSTASAPVAPVAATATDRQMQAFLDRKCPEVFHAVATPTSFWVQDPYDVGTIHVEPRALFDRLLHRAASVPAPPSGSVLVMLGESGSGKTHLMRAFRTSAHAEERGYCGYMQMTTEVSNYARYMLNSLLDGLEQPYSPDGSEQSGLSRLSAGLLELVPGVTIGGADPFRDGDATAVVKEYADRLTAKERFERCDLELLRVMLHLQRPVPQVRKRAIMWLRCQDMTADDRGWIGGAVPRTDDADPLRTLQALARLTDAIHGVPIVLLVDQLEDMDNLSAPVERFRKLVDAVTALTDQLASIVVVVSVLEDYFKPKVELVGESKKYRLTHDPEPIRLLGNVTTDEIRAVVVKRLSHLYATAGVTTDSANPLFPFLNEHLSKFSGMRTREVLNLLRQHHQRCITAGRWADPEFGTPPVVPPPPTELEALWNDFHSGYQALVPDDEPDLAHTLADAIRNVSAELPDGNHFGHPHPDTRYLEVEFHKPNNAIDKLVVAVCNANVRGPGFGRQVTELKTRAGDIPFAVVRTIDFPKGGAAMIQLNKMLGRDSRTAVVADADWRRMLAFEAFRQQHMVRIDFAEWQKTSRPLSGLPSLQRILRLNILTTPPRSTPAVLTPPPVSPPVAVAPLPPTPPPPRVAPVAGALAFGRTLSVNSVPVTFEADEFRQHAAFLGGSGSGKTTAALNLIEQLLARDVPVVLLDRKGDLCRYADPVAWDRPLTDPARTAARQSLRDKLDVQVFTPGEAKGRPLALPVVPPGFDQLSADDRETFAQYAAAALGSMVGFKDSDTDKAQRAILAKAIETLAAAPGATVNVPALRELIGEQDESLLTAIGGGYPEKFFSALAQRLLTLELNNKQLLHGGETLDVDALLGTGPHARPGRVRLSVVSTRFLGDAAKVDFWVSQLLSAVSRWCARSPQPFLQAVFLFDEADIYLPATSKPATKGPMEDLLKRARSAGVGVFLATQSPGDFDYKCKENVRTWLLGRVKEPRAMEKLKPMLAAAKGDPAGKLAGQGAGEFHLVRESSVSPVKSDESFVRTEQLAEEKILELARRTRPAG